MSISSNWDCFVLHIFSNSYTVPLLRNQNCSRITAAFAGFSMIIRDLIGRISPARLAFRIGKISLPVLSARFINDTCYVDTSL